MAWNPNLKSMQPFTVEVRPGGMTMRHDIVWTYYGHIPLSCSSCHATNQTRKGPIGFFMNWLLGVGFDDRCLMVLYAIPEPPRPFLPSAAPSFTQF